MFTSPLAEPSWVSDASPWLCVPAWFDLAGKIEVTVEDEFKEEFDVPEDVTVPHGATVECRLYGEPLLTHAHQPVGCAGCEQRVKLVIIVQAVVRIVVRKDGCVVADFISAFRRRIEAVVKLPALAAIFLKEARVDCGPCKLRPGWFCFGPGEIVCHVCVRVTFKVVALAP